MTNCFVELQADDPDAVLFTHPFPLLAPIPAAPARIVSVVPDPVVQ